MAAIVVSNTGTTLVGMVMPGAVTGGVSVTTVGGTAVGSGNFGVTRTASHYMQQSPVLEGTGAVPDSYGEVEQGYSVALSADGNTAIVGGRFSDFDTGAVWIYTRSGGIWSQQGPKLIGTGGIVGQYFYIEQGTSVALSADGNTAVVGGGTDNDEIGAIWIFTRSGGVWTQQGPKLVGKPVQCRYLPRHIDIG